MCLLRPYGADPKFRSQGRAAEVRGSLLAVMTCCLALSGVGFSPVRAATPAAGQETLDVPALRHRAEAGDPKAQDQLGAALWGAEQIAKNEEEAALWFRKASGQGYAPAQAHLGRLLQLGCGVPKDPQEGLKWVRAAVEQRDPEGQLFLGYAYDGGIGLGLDKKEAAKWYRKAAEQGNAEAQERLARCFLEGVAVAKDDSEAVQWFRKAAGQGNLRGQSGLAACAYSGIGMAVDYPEAVRWSRSAAAGGDREAQRLLGLCLESGQGVARNPGEALVYFRKAAEQGDLRSLKALGSMFAEGRGVAKSEVEALKWYRQAANQGDKEALDKCDFYNIASPVRDCAKAINDGYMRELMAALGSRDKKISREMWQAKAIKLQGKDCIKVDILGPDADFSILKKTCWAQFKPWARQWRIEEAGAALVLVVYNKPVAHDQVMGSEEVARLVVDLKAHSGQILKNGKVVERLKVLAAADPR